MLKHKKIAVLGGDARQCALAAYLAKKGASVWIWGLAMMPPMEGIYVAASMDEALQGSKAVIFPVPAFDTEGRLYMLPPAVDTPPVEAILERVPPFVPIYGGRISQEIGVRAAALGRTISDYMRYESVVSRNAALTAEGAVSLAMNELEIGLRDAKIAVLGYGRIGARLAELISSFGAEVSVGARRADVRDHVSACGQKPIDLTDANAREDLCQGYDVILNTVPYRLLNEELLAKMPKKTLLVELASSPGGWDPMAEIPCRTIYAPGLPSKYAPVSAGRILGEALCQRLEEVRA